MKPGSTSKDGGNGFVGNPQGILKPLELIQ